MKPGHRARGSRARAAVASVALLAAALAAAVPAAGPAQADPVCLTQGPHGGTYTVTLCLTRPAEGQVLEGQTRVAASLQVDGRHRPRVQYLQFELDGSYAIQDFEKKFIWTLPTRQFVDGAHVLSVQATMWDGFVSDPVSVNVTFSNGILGVPVSGGPFHPSTGSRRAGGDPLVLAAVGDGASGEEHSDDVVETVKAWNPDLFLYLGDVYGNGAPLEFYNWYGKGGTRFGQFRAITDPTLGNEEYALGDDTKGYDWYWHDPPHYYSFDVAGWHLVSLDATFEFEYHDPQGWADQYEWLKQDLDANTAPCTLVFFHNPVFNVGNIGGRDDLMGWWSEFASHRVGLVLTGHEHDYQRWVPLDGSGSPDPNGVTEFVVGTGGHGITQFAHGDDRLAVGFDQAPSAYGALRLALGQSSASFEFVNIFGGQLDGGSLACPGAG
jgi:hypothetical protein